MPAGRRQQVDQFLPGQLEVDSPGVGPLLRATPASGEELLVGSALPYGRGRPRSSRSSRADACSAPD